MMASQIIRNKKDWSKWVTFFEDMARGKIPYSTSGYYIVDENPEWSKRAKEPNQPVINLVSPVAQTVKQAEAELQEEKTISRGKSISRGKKRQSIRTAKRQNRKKKEHRDILSS